MINQILGKKVGMTQIFKEDGTRVPVTVIEAPSSVLVQKKRIETDGYNAVQLGFIKGKKERFNRPVIEHFKKHGVEEPTKILKEVRVDSFEGIEDLKEVGVEIFAEGDKVDITGVTKGRGFAGVFKRYGIGGAPATRGTHEDFRHIGSLGGGRSSATRVWPGKRLPGHMGCDNKTILGLEVVGVDKEAGCLMIKGAVPGANGGILHVRKTNRGNRS